MFTVKNCSTLFLHLISYVVRMFSTPKRSFTLNPMRTYIYVLLHAFMCNTLKVITLTMHPLYLAKNNILAHGTNFYYPSPGKFIHSSKTYSHKFWILPILRTLYCYTLFLELVLRLYHVFSVQNLWCTSEIT